MRDLEQRVSQLEPGDEIFQPDAWGISPKRPVSVFVTHMGDEGVGVIFDWHGADHRWRVFAGVFSREITQTDCFVESRRSKAPSWAVAKAAKLAALALAKK